MKLIVWPIRFIVRTVVVGGLLFVAGGVLALLCYDAEDGE
jgi:hypothetical protein